MSRAQSLAEAVLTALKAGHFIDAFSEAGKSMEKSEDIAQQYIKAYEAYMKDPIQWRAKRDARAIGGS